jgi:hypothetical protein
MSRAWNWYGRENPAVLATHARDVAWVKEQVAKARPEPRGVGDDFASLVDAISRLDAALGCADDQKPDDLLGYPNRAELEGALVKARRKAREAAWTSLNIRKQTLD